MNACHKEWDGVAEENAKSQREVVSIQAMYRDMANENAALRRRLSELQCSYQELLDRDFSMRARSGAWYAVVEQLSVYNTDVFTHGPGTGQECAIKEIRELQRKARLHDERIQNRQPGNIGKYW